METYTTGDGPQQIKLNVDITTNGIAGSRASAKKPTGSPAPVANSSDVTGDIKTKDIGSAQNLKGSDLVISTLIDLKILGDKDARKAESERIKATYTFDNGLSGHVVYDKPDSKIPNSDYTTVILVKQIKLV